eukprot:gene286-373_t
MVYRKLRYDPILVNSSDWPTVKIHQNKAAFLEAVSDKAVAEILMLQPDVMALRTDLAKSLVQDQARLQRMNWKVDTKQDATFWAQQVEALHQENVPLATTLKAITTQYSQEIVGGFDVWHYRLAQAAASYALNKLLNPLMPRRLRTLEEVRRQLQEQIIIRGPIDEVRQLARQGTVVMVPTHCSNFDSVLIGWVIETLGLPPFIYGAGLNLFNRQFFAYFMNKLGAYKVDRRKKDVAYLTTLKAYSSLALHWGCHGLFYPGGTRSRTGALESTVKLGLLGTSLDAQQMNYRFDNERASKIFIVPVVFNYHFVLEAPFLIREALAEQGDYVASTTKDWMASSRKLLKLIKHVATKKSSITVSLGQPMDVLGNTVDATGASYDKQGNGVDLYAYFRDKVNKTAAVEQEMKEHTKLLGQRIVASYRVNNCVLTSSLLAFTAFELMRKKYAALPLKTFLKLSSKELMVPYELLEQAFAKVRNGVLVLESKGEIGVSALLKQGTVAGMIADGLANLGLYHHKIPLLRDKVGNITTRDICSVIGAGGFGTAIANLLARNADVLLYVRNAAGAEEIERTRSAAGQVLASNIIPTTRLADITNCCQVIFPMIPSQGIRQLLTTLSPLLTPQHILIHGIKGLDISWPQVIHGPETSREVIALSRHQVKTISELILTVTPVKYVGCIAGPNLASELAKNHPAAIVVASNEPGVMEIGQRLLRSEHFQVYTNGDRVGVEWCGVLKNIIAIGAGCLGGLGYGENAKALLISRGLVEMIHIGKAMGASVQPFLGLAGIGDLVATCASKLSRNYTVGYRLAQGETLSQILDTANLTAEGVYTVRAIRGLMAHYKLRAPITEMMYRILFNGVSVQEAINYLMKYPLHADVDFL